MTYPFQNLIFEGGGVKGIAYVGAMEVLEEKGILDRIVRVGGTSAGAITATLIGLGYSVEEMEELLRALDFNNFLDDSWGVIRDGKRLIADFGWYKGDFFRSWIGGVVAEKTGNPDSTFRDLRSAMDERPFRDLSVVGTNLSTGFVEVFSNEHTPRVCVADAVRISMSIPLFFAARRNFRGDLYVDGGVLDNYPVKLFDRRKYIDDEAHARETEYYEAHNESLAGRRPSISRYVYNRGTLGFRLDSAEEIAVFRDQAEPPRHEIDDFFDYAWRLVRTLASAQENRHLHGDDWQRTVYIDTLGVGTTDFDLGEDGKSALVESGRRHARAYFGWYDDPANEPANRA